MGGTAPAGSGRDVPVPDPRRPLPRDARPEGPGPRRARLVRWALVPVLLLAALEPMVVATALPAMAGELHGADRMSWALTVYLLASAVALPVHGRLGELHGRKGVFLCAVLVFVTGSALAGRARTMDELIAFRALQGLGAGGLMTGVQAILAAVVPPRGRARSVGLMGAAFGLASVAGPLLGGYLTDHFSWRWCFYLNVPFGLLTLVVVAAALKLPRPVARARPDVLGALLLTAAATCLVLLAGRGGTEYARDSRVVLGLAAGAVVSTVLFLLAERHAAAPLVPLRLFRDGVFTGTALVGVAVGAALCCAASCLPAYFQLVGGASATRSGLLMLPMTAGIVGASIVSGHLVGRGGRHRVHPVLGCALSAVGMWLLSGLDADTPPLHHGLWTALLGAGIGLVMPVLVHAVQHSAHPRDLDTASSAHTCFRQLGGCVGAAVLGSLLAARPADPPAGPREAYIAAYGDALPRLFLLLVPVLVLGLLVALFLRERPPVPHHRAPAPGTGPSTAPLSPLPGARTPCADGVPVRGTVRHPDGTVVPGAALTLIDVAGRQVGRGTSGEDGRYALSAPGPAESYVLIAAAGGHQPQAVGVTVAERAVDLDVVLGGTGRLAGRVVTADGTPVADATVTLTDVYGEVVASTRCGRDGGYVLAELAVGEYTLAASAEACRPAAVPVGVRGGRETRQEVELAGGAVLWGTVRAGGGRAVGDARVTLLDGAGNVVETSATGGDGTFRFDELPSGEYTVIAAGYPPGAAESPASRGWEGPAARRP